MCDATAEDGLAPVSGARLAGLGGLGLGLEECWSRARHEPPPDTRPATSLIIVPAASVHVITLKVPQAASFQLLYKSTYSAFVIFKCFLSRRVICLE